MATLLRKQERERQSANEEGPHSKRAWSSLCLYRLPARSDRMVWALQKLGIWNTLVALPAESRRSRVPSRQNPSQFSVPYQACLLPSNRVGFSTSLEVRNSRLCTVPNESSYGAECHTSLRAHNGRPARPQPRRGEEVRTHCVRLFASRRVLGEGKALQAPVSEISST